MILAVNIDQLFYQIIVEKLNLQDSKKKFQIELDKLSYGSIKTEIVILDKFYLAEDYHQKYLHKNPNGYCGLKGTGASYF